jgi:hypothetical protein
MPENLDYPKFTSMARNLPAAQRLSGIYGANHRRQIGASSTSGVSLPRTSMDEGAGFRYAIREIISKCLT